MKALLDRLDKPVREQFLLAIRGAKSRAYITSLVQAIESGIIEDILQAAGVREGMYSPFSEALRSAYVQSGTFVMANEIPKRFGMEFNIQNPRAESWLRNWSSAEITRIKYDQMEAVQRILTNGAAQGWGPRQTALDIVGRVGPNGSRTGGVLGLNKPQAEAMIRAQDDLRNLDPRYLKRKLRDRRFDKVFRKHMKAGTPIPAKTQQKMISRYADRMLKHRGDTIARTESLHALNEAGDEAMRQVVDEGLAPKNAVVKIWRHSFSKNEREGHVLMNGQQRLLDEYFENPLTRRQLLYPGDPAGGASEVINCRCYIEHQIDFAAVEQRTAA